ncbi:MAG: ribosome silencing factor [Clostridia bacterium]|nr:ribosome silencing factor [Clostridia bacterium]
MTTEEKITKIVGALDDKKGTDIKVLKIADLTVLTEYFVIATGTSTTQVRALIDEVDYKLEEAGEKGKLEGKATDWKLIDFDDVIVHVFTPEARDFYNLEKLWADAEEISI